MIIAITAHITGGGDKISGNDDYELCIHLRRYSQVMIIIATTAHIFCVLEFAVA
jgi:hypothetical protein